MCQQIAELRKTPNDPVGVASRLALHSIEAVSAWPRVFPLMHRYWKILQGSQDNHSIIVIQFVGEVVQKRSSSEEFLAEAYESKLSDDPYMNAYIAVRRRPLKPLALGKLRSFAALLLTERGKIWLQLRHNTRRNAGQ